MALLALASRSLAQSTPAKPIEISAGWRLTDVTQEKNKPEALSAPGFPATAWHPAIVPGTVLTSLVADGTYPEPLYGENNRPDKIPESLCRTSYWYRTEFAVPKEFDAKHIWLNFEGINYIAEVCVNGKHAGDIKGAFTRGQFEITDLVKSGQPAAIAVKINPPPHPGNPQEQTVTLGTGPNGGILMQDGPTFGSTIGWDWIPPIRDRNMGIWQKVTLSATGPVVVQDPSVSSDLPLPKTDSADLTLITTLKNATDKPQAGRLFGTFENGTEHPLFSKLVTLQPHETREVTITPAEAAALHVLKPKLWWPNTYGEPNLYKMRVWFEMGEVAGDSVDVSDAREVNFGIRKITYHVTPGEPLIPQTDNLTLFVNGVPVMCKGGCWGMDEAMKRIPRERLESQIRYHALANYTMIRNWVGQSTSEDFYDLCDKYGIMVWDEMFQANQSDGPQVGGNPAANDTPDVTAWRAATIDMYLANVREKVLRYRSHPSIALWCGRNESYPAPKAIADGLTKMTAELDPARFYQANSGDGRGVKSGGPYAWRVPAAYYAAPRGAMEPFKTELGSVSIPTLEAIKAMMPEKDWYDLNDDWASHDLCSGAQEGNTFPQQIASRYGKIAAKDLPDFVRKSQMAMYETYRAMYEGRMAKLFDPCSAVLTWMSNPSQPSFVWQLYSYDLEPLAALYGAKKANEPLHIMLNQNDWHVTVVNTMPEAKENLQATVRVFNMDGTPAAAQNFAVNAKPCAATTVAALRDLALPATLSPVHFVKLELRGAAKNLISENFYWRTTATVTAAADADGFGAGGARGGRGARPAPRGAVEDFSALQSMPTVELQVAVARHDAPGKCLIDVTLTNSTKTPALQAHVQLRNARTGLRVLPVFYSDNFVSLLPGESRTISMEADLKLLGADGAQVVVDGWNVNVGAKSAGNVAIAPNTPALVGPK